MVNYVQMDSTLGVKSDHSFVEPYSKFFPQYTHVKHILF